MATASVSTFDLTAAQRRSATTMSAAHAAFGLNVANAANSNLTMLSQVHVVANAGQLFTTSAVDFNANTIKIPLNGQLGGVPYDAELDLAVAVPEWEVTVTLIINAPFQFQHQWTLSLAGIALPNNAGFAASGPPQLKEAKVIMPGPGGARPGGGNPGAPANPPPAGGFPNIPCIIGCAVKEAGGAVGACLLALIGGVHGFLACLAVQAPGALVNIIQCIGSTCG